MLGYRVINNWSVYAFVRALNINLRVINVRLKERTRDQKNINKK